LNFLLSQESNYLKLKDRLQRNPKKRFQVC
jgi:hypothetical protein